MIAGNTLWSFQIFSSIIKKMSSFTNSFDSEIVLLGKHNKHSKVASYPPSILPSQDIQDEQDLGIQDSVSVRTFSSNFQTSAENSPQKSGLFLHKNSQNQKPPVSAAFSSTSDIRRKRKISKVKTKAKTQRDELAEAVLKGDLERIDDIIDVLDMLHGRGFFVVLSYRYSYNPDTDTVTSQDASQNTDYDTTIQPFNYSQDLNIIHLACIFDQEQVIDFLAMYGLKNLQQR